MLIPLSWKPFWTLIALAVWILAAPQVGSRYIVAFNDSSLPGTQALLNGQTDAGIRQIRAALLRPVSAFDQYQLIVNLCGAYSIKGAFGTAIKHCERSVEINGEQPLALNNRGVALAGHGMLAAALADFSDACEATASLVTESARALRHIACANKHTVIDRLNR